MQSLQVSLRSLVRTVAHKHDEVIVTEVLPGKGFQVGVALTDYHAVLSKMSVIKTLAMRMAEMPEGQSVIINLVVNENVPPLGSQTTRT